MTRTRLAAAAIAAQVAFVLGWLVLGALEGHGYSPGRDDVSDLGALTAHHTMWWQLVVGASGALTMAFAIWALRPALTLPGRRAPLAAWLVVVSLPSLDNLGDAFFRLDCRAADAGCSTADAAASWHGKAHLVVFAVAAVPTLIAPFALARSFRQLEGWRDLARPARVFGVVAIIGFVVTAATSGTAAQGWTQRGIIVIVCSGIVLLATRVLRQSTVAPRAASRPERNSSSASGQTSGEAVEGHSATTSVAQSVQRRTIAM